MRIKIPKKLLNELIKPFPKGCIITTSEDKKASWLYSHYCKTHNNTWVDEFKKVSYCE